MSATDKICTSPCFWERAVDSYGYLFARCCCFFYCCCSRYCCCCDRCVYKMFAIVASFERHRLTFCCQLFVCGSLACIVVVSVAPFLAGTHLFIRSLSHSFVHSFSAIYNLRRLLPSFFSFSQFLLLIFSYSSQPSTHNAFNTF